MLGPLTIHSILRAYVASPVFSQPGTSGLRQARLLHSKGSGVYYPTTERRLLWRRQAPHMSPVLPAGGSPADKRVVVCTLLV
jgi:hypothetical protein